MNRSTLVLAIAVPALAAACFVMLYKLDARHTAIADQVERIQKLQSEVRVDDAPYARRDIPPEMSAAAAPDQAPGAGTSRALRIAHNRDHLIQQPAYQAAQMEARAIGRLAREKDAARQWMEISDQKLQDIFRLEARYDVEQEALRAASRGVRDDVTMARSNQLQQSEDAELRSLLGERKHARWQEWKRMGDQRSMIATLNDRLPATEVVRDEVLGRVASAMRAADGQVSRESESGLSTMPDRDARRRVRLEGSVVAERKRHESMLAAAAPHLTAKQLEVMRGYLKEEIMDKEVSVREQLSRLPSAR